MIDKKSLLLYAITDRKSESKKDFYKKVCDALDGGITCLQLREKTLEKKEFIKEAKEIKRMCASYNVPLIINDDFDVAAESGADGVHVGQNDMSVSKIRKKAGKGFIIGATAKTAAQAKKAETEGADYLGVGAVFPSPTKADALRITVSELSDICLYVKIPVVAIGGINLGNIKYLKGAQIAGVAVISALFGSENISLTAKALKEACYKTFYEIF